MSSITAVPDLSMDKSRSAWPRVGAVALLGVLELLALTIRYDSQALVGQGWIGDLAALSRTLPQLVLIGFTAFIVARNAAATKPFRLVEVDRWDLPPAVLLGLHLLCYAAFFLITAGVVANEPAFRVPRTAAWLATAAGVAVSAALLAFPARGWLAFFSLARPHALVTALIGGCAYGFSLLTPLLWKPLSGATLDLAARLLSLFYSDIIIDRTAYVVGTDRFSVEIAPQCSGYEGIGMILVFIAAYLWIARDALRFPRAFLLLPLGTAAIWLTNVVRITSLIAVGTSVSPEVAAGGFHSQAGWLAFNAVGLGLVFLARGSRLFARTESVAVESSEIAAVPPELGPTVAYLAPLLALVLAGMICTAFSSGFEWLYPLKAVAVLAALGMVRTRGATWSWTWSWSGLAIGVVVFVVWMALEPTPSPSSAIDQGLAGLSPIGRWTWLFFRVFGSVVTVPIAEELAFRGYVPRRLLSSDFTAIPAGRFTIPTLMISSVLFGLMHGRAVAGTLAGLAYAFALSRRGKLGDAILAHAVTNLLIAVYVMTTGRTSVWS